MARIEYLEVREAMLTYAKEQVQKDCKTDVYTITSNYTQSVGILGSIPVSVLLKFIKFNAQPDMSETSYGYTREAIFELLFAPKALDDDEADTLLGQALSDFEWYMSDREPGNAFNTVFDGYSIEKIEVNQGEIGRNKEAGLIGWMNLSAFIMED